MALLVGKFVCAGQTKSIKESRPICHFDMKRVGRGLTAPGIPLLKIKTRNPETRRERRKRAEETEVFGGCVAWGKAWMDRQFFLGAGMLSLVGIIVPGPCKAQDSLPGVTHPKNTP